MSEVNISASAVKELREQTGVGMMDCKKALVEANGDFDKAIELLRLRGQKMSEKRADRDAKEGVVIALVSADNKKGVVVRLSCETDFVSKNEDFINLTKDITKIAMDKFCLLYTSILVCVCFLLGISMSFPLWAGERIFPHIPIFQYFMFGGSIQWLMTSVLGLILSLIHI